MANASYSGLGVAAIEVYLKFELSVFVLNNLQYTGILFCI
jgi:hypothetical protein